MYTKGAVISSVCAWLESGKCLGLDPDSYIIISAKAFAPTAWLVKRLECKTG